MKDVESDIQRIQKCRDEDDTPQPRLPSLQDAREKGEGARHTQRPEDFGGKVTPTQWEIEKEIADDECRDQSSGEQKDGKPKILSFRSTGEIKAEHGEADDRVENANRKEVDNANGTI